MRTSSIIAGLVALATSQVSAQYYANQTRPFQLILHSHNETLNGTALTACHEGAAIEGLCVLPGDFSQFTFNYSASAPTEPATGTTGLLTYELRGGNFNESEPMAFTYNPASNVAVPLFSPAEDGTLVAFDAHGRLMIPSSIDDRKASYNESTNPYNPALYNRWQVCITTVGYTYQTLAWTLGEGKPENPTCQSVNVVRRFL